MLVGVGEGSLMKASTSAGVGGRPVRSKVTRRMSVARSASGEGESPSASRRARMKASMGLRIQAEFFTAGRGGFFTGTNAQSGSYFAPCSIQRRRMSFCWLVNTRCESAGGMRSSGSSLAMRRQASLLLRLPGTMGVIGSPSTPSRCLKASSGISRRSLASRWFLSKPWHLKQVSERIGRTSRLNRTAAAGRDAGAAAPAGTVSAKTIATRNDKYRMRNVERPTGAGDYKIPPRTANTYSNVPEKFTLAVNTRERWEKRGSDGVRKGFQ